MDLFREEAIERYDQICSLTEEDLRDLGLKIGVRLRLLNAIAALAARAGGESSTTSRTETILSTGTPSAAPLPNPTRQPITKRGDQGFGTMGDRWDGTVPPGGHHLQIDASHPGLVLVHETPPLYFCEDFLSPSECDELVAICDPLLKRSRTDSGVTNTEAPRKTSKSLPRS